MQKIAQLLNKSLSTMGKRELCRALGISPASLFNYLANTATPTMRTIERFATYYHKPVTWFFESDSTPFPEAHPTPDELRVLRLLRRVRKLHPVVVDAMIATLESLDPGEEQGAPIAGIIDDAG